MEAARIELWSIARCKLQIANCKMKIVRVSDPFAVISFRFAFCNVLPRPHHRLARRGVLGARVAHGVENQGSNGPGGKSSSHRTFGPGPAGDLVPGPGALDRVAPVGRLRSAAGPA